MITCLIETETNPALADDPLWVSEYTAAMVPLNCKPVPCHRDRYYAVDRMDALAAHAARQLNAIPAGRGLRCLNLGGWFSKPATDVVKWDDGEVTPKPYNPDPSFWFDLSTRLAGIIRDTAGPSAIELVFLDDEGGFITKAGAPEKNEQANRMAWLRRVTEPFVQAFGCKRINYNCGSPKPGMPTMRWSGGGPIGRGTIDGISSVDSYSDETDRNKTWAWKRQNVAACVANGPTIPHHPPLIWNNHKVQVATPEQAACDLYDAILTDSARGVTQHICASYMWKNPLTGSVDLWPLMAQTVKDAVRRANRLGLVEGGN